VLSAIREIGRWQLKTLNKNSLDVLIKSPFDTGKMVFIKIDLVNKNYDGVELEDYDPDKNNKYLFREGPPNGINPTPAAKITALPKTFNNKIKKWFDKYSDNKTLSAKDKSFLEEIRKILTDDREQIIKAIESCIADIPMKEGKLLTIKIKHDMEWEYIGDIDIFKRLLIERESKKIDGIYARCSLCGEEKELSKDVGVFKFYTIDKPGFIAGGLDESIAWRNFPLCPECRLELEEGKKFIENSLSKRFVYGLNYILIPKLLVGKSELLNEILTNLSDSNRLVSLKGRVKKKITDDEEEILELLADEKDILTLNFLFIDKPPGSSAERIRLFIEDVFPSRIKRIFDVKDFVDKVSGASFTFRDVRTFFSKSDDNKRNYDLNKYFLEIVDKVFRGKVVDFSLLVKFFMKKIRDEFINDRFFNQTVKSALMSTLFFEHLGLITFKEVKDMGENIFDIVFTRYGSSFKGAAERGIFLVGVLTQMLLNKQWSDRSAKPFMKNLKGLKMDERDIRSLLPKIQNKLEEYDSFDKGKRLIASEASRYLLQAGDGWKIPVDVINFYFVSGMNLSGEIASIVYPKDEQKGEEE